MTAFDQIIGRLERVREIGSSKHARRVLASCPTDNHKNGDAHPSLIVTETYEGDVLLYCHAHCDPRDIAGTLGLELRQLFARGWTDRVRAAEKPKISARDALQLVSHEAHVVVVGACDFARGVVKPEDVDRVALAASRIRSAMSLAGVKLS